MATMSESPKKRGPKGPTRFTEAAQEAALSYVRANGLNPGAMAEVAGVSMRTVRRHVAENPEFSEALDEARWQFLGDVERSAYVRAIEGVVVEETFDKVTGELVTRKRKYSDPVLLHLLRANGPEKHRDMVKVEKTITGQVEHRHTGTVNYDELSPEKRRLVRRLLAEPAAEES